MTVEPMPSPRAILIFAGCLALSGCARIGFAPVGDGAVGDGAGDGAGSAEVRDLDGGPGADVAPLPEVPGSWVGLAAGSFVMGSPELESCHLPNETQHLVDLTHAFEMTTTEVTQAQFAFVLGYSPFFFATCGGTCPAENLSWHEAAAYCNALSGRLGLDACYSCSGSGAQVTCQAAAAFAAGKIYSCPGFRLPTEAEWEHAYRAGTTSLHYAGTVLSGGCNSCSVATGELDQIAWYCANGGSQTHPTGLKAPNAVGLFDMAGNVSEWIHDGYVADLGAAAVSDPWGGDDAAAARVVRGGSFLDYTQALRAAARMPGPARTWNRNVGFRCVRSR